ncbi:Hypothetical predicted protein [Lecanosticta acicola]|uniref:Uncharacterized protein n=1 Tax=Lecanosticta acicola TaxID=111012 RepID=A0AAI8Z6Y0_9PEZI|nr:Hypothetical predicted protein [Lecanosticta acicola]
MGCIPSKSRKSAIQSVPPREAPKPTANRPQSSRCLAEQSLEECLPPADNAHTGVGRYRAKRGAFPTTAARKSFIRMTLLILSDNGLRNISACRVELFFPQAGGQPLCRASLAATHNNTIVQSIISQQGATDHRSAFAWLVMEIEAQFETMIRKTARNVHPSSRPLPPDEAVTKSGAPLRRPVSMSTLRYPQPTMRTPNFLSLSPQPTTWTRGTVKRISNHGLPSPGIESPQNSFQLAKPPSPSSTQAQAARSSVALQHRYHHQRFSDLSNTSLHFSTSLAPQAHHPAPADGVAAPVALPRQSSSPGSSGDHWTAGPNGGAPTARQQRRSLRQHSSTSALPPSTALSRPSTSVLSLETLAEHHRRRRPPPSAAGDGGRDVEIAKTLGSLVGEQQAAAAAAASASAARASASANANASAGPPSPRCSRSLPRPPTPEKSARRSLAAPRPPAALEYYGLDELARSTRHDSGDDKDRDKEVGVKIREVGGDGNAGREEREDELFG